MESYCTDIMDIDEQPEPFNKRTIMYSELEGTNRFKFKYPLVDDLEGSGSIHDGTAEGYHRITELVEGYTITQGENVIANGFGVLSNRMIDTVQLQAVGNVKNGIDRLYPDFQGIHVMPFNYVTRYEGGIITGQSSSGSISYYIVNFPKPSLVEWAGQENIFSDGTLSKTELENEVGSIDLKTTLQPYDYIPGETIDGNKKGHFIEIVFSGIETNGLPINVVFESPITQTYDVETDISVELDVTLLKSLTTSINSVQSSVIYYTDDGYPVPHSEDEISFTVTE